MQWLRSFYLFPYVVWIIITVVLVEFNLINESLQILLYCVFTLMVTLSLEIIRNRMLKNESRLNKTRIILYVVLNLMLGLPLILILIIASLPLMLSVGISDQGTLMSWQQYLLIGYFSIWLISNLLILKPDKTLNALLLLLSPIIMIASSIIIGPLI